MRAAPSPHPHASQTGPPGLFRQKRNNQEMQPKRDKATQQPQPSGYPTLSAGYPTLTRAPRANADAPVTIPSWNISSPPPSRHCAPRPHGPHRRPPAVRPPSPGGCFPQGKTTFVLYLRCAKLATEPFTRTTSNSHGSPVNNLHPCAMQGIYSQPRWAEAA